MEFRLAQRAQGLRPGDIRELLKLAMAGKVISFAGGSPDAKLFPVERVKQAMCNVMDNEGAMSLQYGATEGYLPLRKLIAEQRMKAAGLANADVESVQVTSGSQQGLDMIGRALLEKGDGVIVERPTYSGAVNAFKSYQPQFLEVGMDEDGIKLDMVEDLLKGEQTIKLIYTVPDFQNPSGRVMSLEKRKSLLALSEKYGVPIVEDAPYADIYFGEKLPSIKSLDKTNAVIYNGSFSKIFSPGIRVAWIYADTSLVKTLTTLKQGSDLHSSSLDQRIVAFYMQENSLDDDINHIREVYRSRRDAMMRAIGDFFPEDAKVTHPQGGFFVWMELKSGLNSGDILKEATEEGVIFVPGRGFFANGGGEGYLRLSYVTVSEDKIREGIEKLGRVLKRYY